MNKMIDGLYRGYSKGLKMCEQWVSRSAEKVVDWVQGGARRFGENGESVEFSLDVFERASSLAEREVEIKDEFVKEIFAEVDEDIGLLLEKADDFFNKKEYEKAFKVYDFVAKEYPMRLRQEMFFGDSYSVVRKVYEGGFVEKALEYATLYGIKMQEEYAVKADVCIGSFPGVVEDDVLTDARMFFEGEHYDLGFRLCRAVPALSPYHILKRFEVMLNFGHVEEAKAYGREVLKEWGDMDEQKVKKYFSPMVGLALVVGEEKEAEAIARRAQAGEGGSLKFCDVVDLKRVLKQKRLMERRVEQGESSGAFLVSRAQVDLGYFDRYAVSEARIAKALSVRVARAEERSEVSAKIIRAIHMHGKRDPRFVLDLFTSQMTDSIKGVYMSSLKRVGITLEVHHEEFESVLVHEFCHMLMDLLYDNATNPYREKDKKMRYAFEDARYEVDKLRKRTIDNPSESYTKAVEIINAIGKGYCRDHSDLELIARYPQILAMGYGDDPEVQKLIKPIKDYWETYVAKDMEVFFEKTENKKIASELLEGNQKLVLKPGEYEEAMNFRLSNKALMWSMANYVLVGVLFVIAYQLGKMR